MNPTPINKPSEVKTKNFLRRRPTFLNPNLVVFIIVFAVIGGYFLWHSFATAALVGKLEVEQMSLPAGSLIINDTTASGGQAVQITQNGNLTGGVTTNAVVSTVVLTARGTKCQGWPQVNLSIDGTSVLSTKVTGTSWHDYTATVSLSAAVHKIAIRFTNASLNGTCARSLYLDVVKLLGSDAVTPPPAISLNASPNSVNSGSSSTLTWSSANTSSCTASGAWSGTEPTTGSASTGALNKSSTYSLSCSGAAGTTNTSTTITVASSGTSSSSFCITCIKIRVGRPLIARGPFNDELDNPFNEIQLSTGQYRGFSANSSSYAIDGSSPTSMGGSRTQVLASGSAGTYNECGQWLNDTEKVGGTVYGFIHDEMACSYSIGQTHKSMSVATSTNEGLNWSTQGQIIKGTDSPTAGKITGEGDCTVINGQDGYYYAYCLRASDWRNIVARAPVSNPGPGQWNKYYAGSWSQPGLGGNSSSLGFIGSNVGRWTDNGAVIDLNPDKWFGGLRASFSTDKVTFTSLAEPLMVLDDTNWSRPATTELVAYPSILNHTDGNNQFTSPFLLSYVYIQPNEGFNQRYLVFRDVTMTMGTSNVSPQVGVALARWYNSTNEDRWSTTAPVPGNYSSYSYEGSFGYLLTKPDSTKATVKLQDCVSYSPGHPDHLLEPDCSNGGYTFLRTAGWVYQNNETGTVPLYRCYSSNLQNHFVSNRSDCEGLGSMEWILGYALAN